MSFFVANVFIFSFKSYLLFNFFLCYLCIKCITRELITTINSKKYLFSISDISISHSAFLTRSLLTLSILFSSVVRAAVVAELVILAISPITSFILILREALVAKLVMSGI